MDDSLSSTNYRRNSLSSTTADDDSSTQESSWTSYLVDLIANNCDKEDDPSCSSFQSSSMMSEAASFSLRKCRNKLISKRRKNKVTFVDQDLVDTATSPVHNHKVNDMSCMFMKSKEEDSQDVCEAYDSNPCEEQPQDSSSSCSQEKGHTTTQNAGEGMNMGFLETELRRKGLCLVPMTMFLNCVS